LILEKQLPKKGLWVILEVLLKRSVIAIMKKGLSIICTLALVLGMIIPSSNHVHATDTCPACGATNVEWETLDQAATITPDGHYRLTYDLQLIKKLSMNNSTEDVHTYCLDLAGYTITGPDRTIIMNNSGTGPVVFNLMDSSSAKTGRVEGYGVTQGGGIVYMYGNATMNMYGGTIAQVENATAVPSWGGIFNIRTNATLNMYGGKIVGTTTSGEGGAIYLYSDAIFYAAGGEIISGISTGNKGGCINADTDSTVTLTRSARIAEVYFENAAAAASILKISGSYTGKTVLNFATMPEDGTVIGTGSNASIGTENITIVSPRMSGQMSGNNLVAKVLTGVTLKPKGRQAVCYPTLSAAAKDVQDGGVIMLLADNNENVTIPYDVTLDLNGWDLNGNINATGTLNLKDSATDDFVAQDPIGVGVVSGTITGNTQTAKNYIALKTANGTTYHRYTLKLTNVSLRPGVAGVYYKADIKMDEMIREKQVQFGIAASVYDTEPSLESDQTLYTSFGEEDYNNGATKGALFTEFLDKNNSTQVNAQNATTDVYGRPYFQYTDESGTHCLYGSAYATNLQAVTEKADEKLCSGLSLVQNRALLAMYDTYQTEMADWKVINAAVSAAKKQAAADDGVFKAIVIGNSASTDAIALLAAIFKAEAPDQEFVLGCMYESGCPIKDHITFFKNDLPAYSYFKNTGSNANGAWSKTNDVTLQTGLTDQNWDVVIFQELHTISGLMSTFENDNVEILIKYVVDQLGYEPQLDWHSVGIIPEIPEAYVEYVKSVDGDDGGGIDAGENENWQGGEGGRPEDVAWIFDIACPSYPVTWARNYINNYNNDSQYMFDSICDVAENFIMKNEIYSFDDVIPGGAAIQYAKNGCGLTDRDLFRDYAHKNDFGRVLIGYVWYAELMEIPSFTELKYTTVPMAMRHSSAQEQGDLVLTDAQIKIVLDSVNYALANPFDSPDPVQ